MSPRCQAPEDADWHPKTDAWRPSGVLFDMDGLLLDTERPLVQMWRQASDETGVPVTDEQILATIGVREVNTRRNLCDYYGPGYAYPVLRTAFERIIFETFERDGIRLMKGVVELLDLLDERGVPYAVATSTDKKAARWKLEKAGIADRMKDVPMAFAEDVAHGKPAPDVFLLAADMLKTKPAACVGFEDSIAGIQSLYAAGARPVFIKDMLDLPPDTAALVWKRLDSLDQAVKMF